MDIITKIQNAIESDDIVRADLTLEIKKQYEKSNAETQKTIDRIFIHLTGYSLNTFLYGENEAYNPFE